MAAAAVVYGMVVLALKLAGAHEAPGYASLLAPFTFLAGIQLIVIGVLGLYLGRVYDEVRSRPLYLVRETHGFVPGGDRRPDMLSAPILSHVLRS
jgi:hypothetical protein